jgi:Raf kinase inhibitor-like YbhB/YbcL family protein
MRGGGGSGSNAGTSSGVGGAATGGAAPAGGAGSSGGGGTPAGGIGGSAGGGGGTPAGGIGGAAGDGGRTAAGGIGGAAGGAGTGGQAGSHSGTSGNAGAGGAFTLTSPALEDVPGCGVENPSVCAVFPDENVSYMERANLSPELRWTGVPAGTQSFAIVLMDATYGQAHWVIWNIPAAVSMLLANVPKETAMPAMPAGSQQANANFATHGGDGYFGPHVPCNVFQFQIYALSLSTFSPMEPESAVLVSIELQELGEPVLGLATLTGRSNNYMMMCE